MDEWIIREVAECWASADRTGKFIYTREDIQRQFKISGNVLSDIVAMLKNQMPTRKKISSSLIYRKRLEQSFHKTSTGWVSDVVEKTILQWKEKNKYSNRYHC